MTLNTFSSGVNTSFSSELNDNFSQSGIVELYSGTGFDSTQAAGSSTDTGSYELTAVASATYDYVKITITGTAVCGSSANTGVQLKAQIKETGGAYGDIVAYSDFLKITNDNADTNATMSYTIIAALTAGQKSNGYRIKLFSASTAGAAGTVSFTNVQTVVEKMN